LPTQTRGDAHFGPWTDLRSKNVLKLVIEDIGSQVEIGTALNRISAQKSNRVSADTFYELAAGRAYAHGTESIDLEVAKVYR